MGKLANQEGSLWREAYTTTRYASLRESILQVEVVVIGAGITGLTSAYLLAQSGVKVAVIDKDTIGGGTTGRTTGKVTSQHGLCYANFQKTLGPLDARLYGEANQSAILQMEKIINHEKISCGWKRTDNYVYTAEKQQVAKFKAEARAAAALGLPASFETDIGLPFKVEAAVKFADQAQICAQEYLMGLAEAIRNKGGLIFEHTSARGIRDGKPCHVKTSEGEIIAQEVIVATNVPTWPLMARGAYCALEYPTESYIIAAPYNGNLPGMYISPDRHHYSLLPIEFQGQRYLLIGGGGHLSGLRGSKKWRWGHLAQYAEARFGINEVTHMWSDRDYTAYDKVPLIGKLYPWSKRLYVATAFNKWGLSGGTVAAMLLRDLIIGKPNPWAGVFTPQRMRPIYSIPSAVIEQVPKLLKP